ncbi:type I-E CRISPR-associated protein Cas7/Cse4/CasC [Corynebacterium sp. CNCTC7651]|uniref:type I-E CRISPR-associated protein Cas7/Cse4/CasC n=1 Tax=Corynebacterium sp. CNCTC7651 TaxID=2815361 RepID=UPI001F204D9D|nr:type I-E CRISPR-associated protein Cas7/Cse4/CasC [Corynebacterium sp. CNCTC7651]UIZ92561.1 type I-E CRISPR-associated protein Cas7/Cse4/CasC [Corynebacterium sp. CNCTC7651]
MTLTIDIHALQTVPPSLINRDDTGSPKSAIYGGTPRQRVSSQAWKRAIRSYYRENFETEAIGARSKRLPEKITKQLAKATGWDEVTALQRVRELFAAAKIGLVEEKKPKKKAEAESQNENTETKYPETGYLFFFSQQQIDRAVATLAALEEGEKVDKNTAKEILNSDASVDMAMFGRMVADDASFNIDAAVQVAHAIGVHTSAPEFDYFTAVDDLAADGHETGAGMIGTTQMMSSTLYRYATVNVEGLAKNLGSTEAAHEAASRFIEAFACSMPTGKINTFANQTVPELLYVTVRDTRPISLVTAFEHAVEAKDGAGRREVATRRLAEEATNVREAYGFQPLASYVVGLGTSADAFKGIADRVTLPELAEKIRADLAAAEAK